MKRARTWIIISLIFVLLSVLSNILFSIFQNALPSISTLIINLSLSLIIFASLIVAFFLNRLSLKKLVETIKKLSLATEKIEKIETKFIDVQEELIPLITSINSAIEQLTILKDAYENVENISEEYENILQEISKFNLDVKIPDKKEYEGLNNLRNAITKIIEAIIISSSSLASKISKDRSLNKNIYNIVIEYQQQGEKMKSIIQSLTSLFETMKMNLKVQEDIPGIPKSIQILSDILNASKPKMQEISSKLSEIESSSDSLMKEIKEISDISNQIKEISEQTLLLSMNALIESSKAGEYGKGFAVIADEIRKLSVSINTLSDNISSKTSTMRVNVNKILLPTKDSEEDVKYLLSNFTSSTKELEKLQEIARKVLELVNSLLPLTTNLEKAKDELVNVEKVLESLIINNLQDISMQIKNITFGKLKIIINQYERILRRIKSKEELMNMLSVLGSKIGHISFLIKLEEYAEGKKDLPEIEKEELPNYTACHLGKWYYSVKDDLSKIPAFVKLEKVHKELHENGKKILELLDKGDKAKVPELLIKSEKYNIDIISLLDEIEKELFTHEDTE